MKKLFDNNSQLTDKSYWDSKYLNYQYKPQKMYFRDLIFKHIPNGKGKKCIEIGCYPGEKLLFFTKKLGYIPYGLDFTENLSDMNNFLTPSRDHHSAKACNCFFD